MNLMQKIIIFYLCAMAAATAQSADINFNAEPKQRWSVEWGWNNETYLKSNIHFFGNDHNFSLYGVKATDTQKTLTPATLFNTYLNPGKITIPQTNARIAYRLTSDTALALNLDHMKYVVTDGQTVGASGQFKGQSFGPQQTQSLSPTFMHYEHTDGLNVLSLEYEKLFPLSNVPGNWKVRSFLLVGAGIVIPKSNITMTILEQSRNDKFHLAGTNLDAATGLEIDFLQNYFARTSLKIGRVNLTDVITSARQDKASQVIHYREASLTVGIRF